MMHRVRVGVVHQPPGLKPHVKRPITTTIIKVW